MRQGEVTFVANRISGFFKRCFPVSAGDCLKTLFGLFLATASCIILRELNPGDDYMAAVQVIYVLAAFMIARFTQGFLYGTFAAVAGVLLTNFIFTYPYWAFNFTLPGYPVTILCALIVSVTTSTMTARIKEQGQLQLEAEREKMRSNLLRAVSHDLRMRHMFKAIRRVMDEHPDVKAIYPIHMNPVVREIADEFLGGDDRIHIIEPLDVLDFHNFLSRSYLILTDSGGIQEEAPSLGKPVLVMRDTTERPEGIAAGTLKLVGTEEDTIYNEFSRLLSDKEEYDAMSKASNPYGDGHACERIADVLCGKNTEIKCY